MEGATDIFIPAVETMIIARQKDADKNVNICHLSSNPLERHNIVQSKTPREYKTYPDGTKVNIHEKPAGLAADYVKWYSNPGDWVIVCGAGAGGEVYGCLEAGRYVVAIEQDKKQCDF